MSAADSARKLAALVTIAGVVGASHWLQPVAPRPGAPLLASRTVAATPAFAPEVVLGSLDAEMPAETRRPPIRRRALNQPSWLPVTSVVRSEITLPQSRASAFTEPLVLRGSEASPPSLLAAALRLNVGLAPALDVPSLVTTNRSPLGQMFSIAGRSVGMAVRRTGGAAQGVLIAGTVMIRRVVHL